MHGHTHWEFFVEKFSKVLCWSWVCVQLAYNGSARTHHGLVSVMFENTRQIRLCSSVGRAGDWKFPCRWFDSDRRHFRLWVHPRTKDRRNADLAHLVERNLAKVEVAGSSPVIRWITKCHLLRKMVFCYSNELCWMRKRCSRKKTMKISSNPLSFNGTAFERCRIRRKDCKLYLFMRITLKNNHKILIIILTISKKYDNIHSIVIFS